MRDAILNRISRRKFSAENLTEQETAQIKSNISRINEKSGLNIEFLEDGGKAFSKMKFTYGFFTNVRALLLMKGRKDLDNLNERIGYYGEELVLDLTDMGLGTCWVAGTYDKSSLEIPEDEELICVIPVGKVETVSAKEKIMRGTLRGKGRAMEDRTICDEKMPDWMGNGMQAVQLAPSARNTQKANFALKNGVLSASIADDYPADLIDLGIAKKHFEIEACGKFSLGNGGEFRRDGAGS